MDQTNNDQLSQLLSIDTVFFAEALKNPTDSNQLYHFNHQID